MVSGEVVAKLVRFLYFVGAGVICTKGINLWRDFKRKTAAEQADLAKTADRSPAEMVNAPASPASKS